MDLIQCNSIIPVAASSTPSSPDEVTSAALKLWLKADAEVGYVDGDFITTAQDQSGQNNDATEAGSSGGADHVRYRTNVINGKPAYSFGEGGNAHYDLPNFCSAFTAGEIFLIGILNADPPVLTSDTGLWNFGTSGSNLAFPYTDGHIYEDWGSTARYDSGDPVTSLTSPFVYGVWSASNDWANRINGVTLHTEGTNTVGFTSAPILGYSSLGRMQGKIAEVITYNGKLSTPDRQVINDYIEAKYAITMP